MNPDRQEPRRALTQRVPLAIFCLLALIAFAKEAPKPVDTDIDYDVVGTVTEAGTTRPIQGAYVAVTYWLHRGGSECHRVKGAYTDQHGAFRIPAERIDGLVMSYVYAAAPGYYAVEAKAPAYTRHEIKTSPNPSVPLELVKRVTQFEFQGDSIRRNLHSDYTNAATSQNALDCWRAASREEAAAAIPYLRIIQRESVKHGGTAEFHWRIERIVYLLESLPRRTSGKPVQ